MNRPVDIFWGLYFPGNLHNMGITKGDAMKIKVAVSLLLVLLLGLSACSLTGLNVPPPAATNTLDPQQIEQAIAATFAAQTQVAVYVEQTLTAAALANPASTPNLPGAVFTETPSATFTPSLTTTPNVPMVTVSSETNCRSGPGQVYDKLGVLNPGETTEVVGRTTVANYWLVRNPDNPAQVCWLWGEYATVTGDWQSLPQATQPPTPTPVAGFTVSYLSTVTCAGLYGFRFQLTNTGSVTWNSYKVTINDASTATTTTYTDDYFTDYTGCGPFANQLQDLESHEVGVAGNWASGLLSYNPAGHSITATFTLCAQNGLLGECSSKTISFTP
jgi:hypothetical protein